jgi:Rrf2 family protein
MHINTKVRYGVRAMIQIAIDSDKGVLQKRISKQQEISYKYLDQIMASLKAAGLIAKPSKGKGYILARKAEDISVYDIYKAFENEVRIVPCMLENIEDICDRQNECSAFTLWDGLNKTIKSYLQSKNLSDLISKP